MSAPAPATDVEIRTKGEVSAGDVQYARKKVAAAIRVAPEPVLHARAVLSWQPGTTVTEPATVRANVDVNGRLVRAEAARATLREAIDEVEDKLRKGLRRVVRNWQSQRGRSAAAAKRGKPVSAPEPTD